MQTEKTSVFGLVPARPAVGPTVCDLLLRSGTIMLVVLLVAAAFYRIPGVIGGSGEEVGGWFLAIGSLTAYFLGYKALRSSSDNSGLRNTIIGFAIAFVILALLIPPFFSTDVYGYGNIGWRQVKYNLNPYVYSLSETPNWENDPMFYPVWEEVHCPYGFLFSEFTYAVCRLGGGDRDLTALLFKLINAAVFGLTAWLIWRGCKYLGRANPERALYLFLWNPLLLLHVVSDGHNDLFMGFCSTACILSVIVGGWLAAIPLLMAGILVKYGSAIVLPFVLLYIGKRYGKTKAAVGLVLGLFLCGAAAAPYLVYDWRRLPLAQITGTISEWRCYTLSAFLFFPYDVAAQLFPTLAPFKLQIMAAIKLMLWTGFLVFYLRLLTRRLRGAYDLEKLLYDGLLVQFVLVCFVSSKFYPWYLGMFLPLAFWLPAGDKLRHAVLAVACAQVLQFTFIRNANGINAVILLLGPLAYVLLLPLEKNPWLDRVLKKLPYLRDKTLSAILNVGKRFGTAHEDRQSIAKTTEPTH